MKKKVRIGIDVGETFMDAAVTDSTTYDVIAKKKIPTTHEESVAVGMVTPINRLMEKLGIVPGDMVFTAHGTAQATNALLEGDVASVGIIGMEAGMDVRGARNETSVENIELAPGKFLKTNHISLDPKAVNDGNIRAAIDEVRGAGAEVIMASETYSVDNLEHELAVQEAAGKQGLYYIGEYEISQFYGLKMRTRTAVVNVSLIPKMIETANMTGRAVIDTHIQSGLMIMRCDGGVMSINEVRKRPILTMLFGLAAGVTGVLMYERISDGIFFEAGGISVDISVIKNGKVMMKYAQVGRHKTYSQSLDVRALSVAGGSMVRVSDGKIVDIGPYSAYITGKEYECFQEDGTLDGTKVLFVSPRTDNPKEYVPVQNLVGKEYSLVLAGAVNLLGYVLGEDYARGRQQPTRAAWDALGVYPGCAGEEAARKAMDLAMDKLVDVVEELIDEYELNTEFVTLVGSGGSGAVIVHALAERMGVKSKIVKNAPYIFTVGVALAATREQIERTITSPMEEDIEKIHRNIIEKIVKSGANEKTANVTIEVDVQKNILRAIATGVMELRQKDLGVAGLKQEELQTILSEALGTPEEETNCVAVSGRWNVYEAVTKKKVLGFFSQKSRRLCVIDWEGTVRLKKEKAEHLKSAKGRKNSEFAESLDVNITLSDVNATIPKVFIFYREKMLDLIGMQSAEQLNSILDMEIEGLEDSEELTVVVYKQKIIYMEGGEWK